jgi:hypothetical protein
MFKNMINSIGNFIIVGVLITSTLMMIGFSTVIDTAKKADAQINGTHIEQRNKNNCDNAVCSITAASYIVQERAEERFHITNVQGDNTQTNNQPVCTTNCSGNINQQGENNFQRGVEN